MLTWWCYVVVGCYVMVVLVNQKIQIKEKKNIPGLEMQQSRAPTAAVLPPLALPQIPLSSPSPFPFLLSGVAVMVVVVVVPYVVYLFLVKKKKKIQNKN